MKVYIATTTPPPFGQKGSRAYYFKATQKSSVYDAIHASGKDGLTRHEIAAAVNLAVDRIGFYLSDLRRAGCISVKGGPIDMTVMDEVEAVHYAMLALENALVAKAKKQGPSPGRPKGGATVEQDRAFVKYNKIKELALRGATDGETTVATRMCLIELVKLIW